MLAFAAALVGLSTLHAETLAPVALRYEYRVNPLGIDAPKPRLTCRVESDERGARQTAYRLLVVSTPEQLAHDLVICGTAAKSIFPPLHPKGK